MNIAPITEPDLSRSVTLRTVGGPTVVLELGGMRIVVDPTFDDPGTYDIGGGRTLTKTGPPALHVDGTVDLVLLSHDQHPDNLDRSGRKLLRRARCVLTTPTAAERLDVNAVGRTSWTTSTIVRPDGGLIHITAVPARHGPAGTEHLTGPVTGFVLESPAFPTIYVSGDNASLDLVRQIAHRFPHIDIAILFAGAARTPLLGDAYLTLTSEQAATAAAILPHARIIAVHCDSWSHFTEHDDRIVAAFEHAGLLDRLERTAHGHPLTLLSESNTG